MRQFQADPESLGGRAAVTELLVRYQRRVYVWCFRTVRDHEQALDLAQEVLLNAYRALPGFEHRSRFSSWLFAIARNRCLSVQASARLYEGDEAEFDDLIDPAPRPDSAAEQQEQELEILDLITRHLSLLEQRALWLRCFERVSVEDITRVLGIDTASGARGVLQSARRKLRAALDRRGEGSR